VAVIGAAGRMGRLLSAAVADAEDLVLAARIDRLAAVEEEGGKPAGAPAGGGPVPALASMESLDAGIDVAVEFTHGEAPERISPVIRRLRCAWVSGTTALTEGSSRALRAAAEEVPVLWAPNMSLGIHLLNRFCRTAARLLPAGWEMEIVEAHHGGKIDAPSGTALALARGWVEARGGEIIHGRSGKTGPRSEKEVGIHAVRLPEGAGEHRVFLGGAHESLELTHRALDRGAFVSGTLTALRWLVAQRAGLYTLEDWAADRLRSLEDRAAG